MSESPTLRIVKGEPTAAEVAALVAVVAASGTEPEPGAAPRPQSVWSSRGRLVRPPQRPGPGAWRASAWPR